MNVDFICDSSHIQKMPILVLETVYFFGLSLRRTTAEVTLLTRGDYQQLLGEPK